MTPATTNYHGYDVFTLPPPAQTWATDEMLNILEACVPVWAPGQTLASLGPASPKYWHFVVEAKKLAFQDLYAFNADPNFSKVPLDRLLSKAHAKSLCARGRTRLARRRTAAGSNADTGGDTIVLSTADRDGNMVAWVNSLYSGFGSGVTVPGYGISLHNRGGLFTLDPKSPNVIAPQQAPVQHALGRLRDAQRPAADDGDADGRRHAGAGHRAGAASTCSTSARTCRPPADMARFRHLQVPNTLTMESQLFALVGEPLQAMGHTVESRDGDPMGGFQAIMVTPDTGVYRAGSDHRKDGQAVGY